MEEVLGLIAGGGRLPSLVAQGARARRMQVVCAGFDGFVEPELSREVDVFYPVAVARPGSWIRRLRRHDVTRTVMVGRVAKHRLYTPGRILKYLPDWRAFRVYYWRVRHADRRTDSMLRALADELATGGIILEDYTMYCQDHLATPGVMTARGPACEADIEFGWRIAKRVGELDIGQAVAIKEREVLAVEAIEGTAEMIKRAGQYCKSGAWTLVKCAKPDQDMRFDVPCVGPDTIRDLAANGGRCLVLEAGKTIIIDKPETLDLANRLGVAVVGR